MNQFNILLASQNLLFEEISDILAMKYIIFKFFLIKVLFLLISIAKKICNFFKFLKLNVFKTINQQSKTIFEYLTI